MILSELKKVFNKLSSKLKQDKVNVGFEVGSTYRNVSAEFSNDLTRVSSEVYTYNKNKWPQEVKKQKAQKEKWIKQQNKLINKKIKGKTFKDRFVKDSKKLTTDIKNIKKEKDKKVSNIKITRRVKKAYNKTKRIFRTEKHRVIEGAKNLTYKIIKPKDYDKEWNCMFYNSRETHILMHQQIADENGLFWSSSGDSCEYPGGFSTAKENINCKCKVRFIKREKGE